MSTKKQETASDAEQLLEAMEEYLEERKDKSDRRQGHDPEHPNSSPDSCRRSGEDRREPA